MSDLSNQRRNGYLYMQDPIDKVPYCGKLSREKTFTNFVVLGLSAKVFSRENRRPHPLIIIGS